MFLLSIASLSCESLGVSCRRFFRTPWYQELVCALVEGFYFVCPKKSFKKASRRQSFSSSHFQEKNLACDFCLFYCSYVCYRHDPCHDGWSHLYIFVGYCPHHEPHRCHHCHRHAPCHDGLPLLCLLAVVLIMIVIIAIFVIIMILDIAMMVCHSCVCWPVVGPENKFWPQTDKQNYQLYIPSVLQQKYLILYRKDINKYLLYL